MVCAAAFAGRMVHMSAFGGCWGSSVTTYREQAEGHCPNELEERNGLERHRSSVVFSSQEAIRGRRGGTEPGMQVGRLKCTESARRRRRDGKEDAAPGATRRRCIWDDGSAANAAVGERLVGGRWRKGSGSDLAGGFYSGRRPLKQAFGLRCN